MRMLVDDAGLEHRIVVDSAGTSGWHRGELPDPRSRAEARRRGVELTSRGSAFRAGDTSTYDLVLAMDRRNVADLIDLTPEPALRERIRLLRDFDPATGPEDRWDGEVPDPWSGGDRGFVVVYDLIEAACRGLLDHLRAELAAAAQPPQDPSASS